MLLMLEILHNLTYQDPRNNGSAVCIGPGISSTKSSIFVNEPIAKQKGEVHEVDPPMLIGQRDVVRP